MEFVPLEYLFERILAVPASSAPVERVFSNSGLIVRPHRAKMSDKLLESLVFANCQVFYPKLTVMNFNLSGAMCVVWLYFVIIVIFWVFTV